MNIRWPLIISNAELWKATGAKPVMLEIKMRKWLYIGHTVKKGKNPLTNKHWIEICREPGGEKDRSKPRKGPFWRKQENAAKPRVILTESDEDTSRIFCFQWIVPQTK
jgi:hypothetical protein